MKALYRRIVHEHDTRFAAIRERESPPSPEAIACVEAELGVELPRSYKNFLRSVGRASWPREIFGVEGLGHARTEPSDRPRYFLAFATDGGGNDSCFDTRLLQEGEYPILFWDHEDPPAERELAEPGDATPFDEWLEELVNDEVRETENDTKEARQEAIEQALAPHRESTVWPYAPSLDDVGDVEAALGVKLPAEYVWFTTNLGSTTWPFEIVDAMEIERLTSRMRDELGDRAASAFAFGRDSAGRWLAFRKKGVLVVMGEPVVPAGTFFDVLEAAIRMRSVEPSEPEPAPPASTPRPRVIRRRR